MPIFNEKVIKKHVPKIASIPDHDYAVVDGWIMKTIQKPQEFGTKERMW